MENVMKTVGFLVKKLKGAVDQTVLKDVNKKTENEHKKKRIVLQIQFSLFLL